MRKGLDRRKIVNYNRINNNAKVQAEISRPVFVAAMERRNICSHRVFSFVFWPEKDHAQGRRRYCLLRREHRSGPPAFAAKGILKRYPCGGHNPGKDIVNSILVPDYYNRKDIINDILVRRKEEQPPQLAGTQNGPKIPGKRSWKSIAPVTMMTVMTMNVIYTLIMGISPKHRHHRHHRHSRGKGLFSFPQEVAVFASIAFGYLPNANLLGSTPNPCPSLAVYLSILKQGKRDAYKRQPKKKNRKKN